jgi:hypothetical protein
MQDFNVIVLDANLQTLGRYDSVRATEGFVALQRRMRILQKSRAMRHMSPAMRNEHPTLRPIELGQWLGRLEQQKKPSTATVTAPPPPPPAPSGRGKGAKGKAFRLAANLFGDEEIVPPPRGDHSAEHLKDSNAIYWAGYDL